MITRGRIEQFFLLDFLNSYFWFAGCNGISASPNGKGPDPQLDLVKDRDDEGQYGSSSKVEM